MAYRTFQMELWFTLLMEIGSWFFDGWQPILRTLLVGLSTYVALVAILRISGKRTLSKMNMFDWVVTVAIGSAMASALTSDISVARIVTGFVVLVGAQFVVTSLSIRSEKFSKLINPSPTILFYRGEYLTSEMRKERVPKNEILSAIRQSGQGAPADIEAVLLESNGELIVMNRVQSNQAVTLQKASNWSSVGMED